MLMLRRLPCTLSLLAMSIVVASAVTGCKKKEPAAAQAAVESNELVLRAALSERLGASSFAVVGEVARGDGRAIIVWPGLAEGGEPAAPVAHVFTQEEGAWKPVGDPIDLRAKGNRPLAEPGSGERVVRDCGLPEDELAAHLQMHGKAFAAALEAGDSSAAVSAYEQMARAFAWEHVATSTLLLDLLLTPAPKSWYCGEKGCTVESSFESRRRLQTFGHAECGGGKVVGDVLATQP
jgi:hypothetical protein